MVAGVARMRSAEASARQRQATAQAAQTAGAAQTENEDLRGHLKALVIALENWSDSQAPLGGTVHAAFRAALHDIKGKL